MASFRSSVLYLAHRALSYSVPSSAVLARAASTAASSNASSSQPPAPRAKFTISAKATPGEPTVVSTPGHQFFIDEPAKLGGHDKGPSPLLYAVGALAGCEAVTSRAVAREMGIEVNELDFDVTGAIDPRGFRGVPGVPSHFQTVDVQVKIKSPASDAQIDELFSRSAVRCPIHSLMHAAGVNVTLKWTRLE